MNVNDEEDSRGTVELNLGNIANTTDRSLFVGMPDVGMPDVEMLDVEMPVVEMPGVGIPVVGMPGVGIPAVEMPVVVTTRNNGVVTRKLMRFNNFENTVSYLLILGISEKDIILNNDHDSNILSHSHRGSIYTYGMTFFNVFRLRISRAVGK